MTRQSRRRLHGVALHCGRTRLGFAAVAVAVLATACGAGVPSAAEGRTALEVAPPTPTVNLPFPAPTSSAGQVAAVQLNDDGQAPTTAPIPTLVDEGTPTPLAVPETSSTATSLPTPTPQPTVELEPALTPTASATPRATMTPTATKTPSETPTDTPDPDETSTPNPDESPTPVATATPTPVVTVSGGIAQVGISCTISPTGVVNVGEQVQLRAVQQNRASVAYQFDLGDGTSASGQSVTASYDQPDNYVVTLRWRLADEVGVVDCGMVRVVLKQELADSVADFVGLSESQAEALAVERTLTLRVTRRDLILLPGTQDFRLDRVNVELDEGFVASASIG